MASFIRTLSKRFSGRSRGKTTQQEAGMQTDIDMVNFEEKIGSKLKVVKDFNNYEGFITFGDVIEIKYPPRVLNVQEEEEEDNEPRSWWSVVCCSRPPPPSAPETFTFQPKQPVVKVSMGTQTCIEVSDIADDPPKVAEPVLVPVSSELVSRRGDIPNVICSGRIVRHGKHFYYRAFWGLTPSVLEGRARFLANIWEEEEEE